MSTVTRLLRIRDYISDLMTETDVQALDPIREERILAHITSIEQQANLLVNALNIVYFSLGAFSGSTLVTLVGVTLLPVLGSGWYAGLAGFGLTLGAIGVSCIIIGSFRLVQATHLSHVIVNDEAKIIRSRFSRK